MIANALMTHPYLSDQQLATKLKMSRQTVNKWRNSEIVKVYLAEAFESRKTEFNHVLLKAYGTISELLEHSNPAIRLRASECIIKLAGLDRVGDEARSQVNVTYIAEWGSSIEPT